MHLDLDVNEILSTFEAQLHRATLAMPGSHTELWETLTSKICLVAFYKRANFPPENMMAAMGVTRALLYGIDITVQPGFIPTQPHDERWRTMSRMIGHISAHKQSSSSPYMIPGVGTFLRHPRHPRHTLEYLFRDHAQMGLEPGSDESKLFDLFGSLGKKLRAPVAYPCPPRVREDHGQAGLGVKRRRGRPRGSTNKVKGSSNGAQELMHWSTPTPDAPASEGPRTAAANHSSRKREHDSSGLHEPSSGNTNDFQWSSGRPKRQKISPGVVLPSSLISPPPPKKAPSGKRKVAGGRGPKLSAHHSIAPKRVRDKVSAVRVSNVRLKEAAKGTNDAGKPRGRPPKAILGGSSTQPPSNVTHSTRRTKGATASDTSHDGMASSSSPYPTMSSDDCDKMSATEFVMQAETCYSPTSSSDSPIPKLPLAFRRKYVAVSRGVTSHGTNVSADMSISDLAAEGEGPCPSRRSGHSHSVWYDANSLSSLHISSDLALRLRSDIGGDPFL